VSRSIHSLIPRPAPMVAANISTPSEPHKVCLRFVKRVCLCLS
jgi:hypothetical protein